MPEGDTEKMANTILDGAMQPIKINKVVLLAISLLVIMASGLGLFVPDFYAHRNNTITIFEIAGQDIVSLIIGVLLFVLILVSNKVKSFPVIVVGLLVYTTYTYAYFLFGLIVSKLYIVYLVIAGLSFHSVIIMLIAWQETKLEAINSRRKAISVYLIFVVVLVGLLDAKDIIAKTILLNGVMNTWGAFYIQDLVFLFPAIIVAAIMNLKRSGLGRFFTGAFLIKTIALMPALILADILHYVNKGVFVDFSFDVIAVIVMISAIVFYCVYHKDMMST